MSYSFSVTGTSKADAKAAATNRLDLEIQQQPVHSRDREAALGNVDKHLALLDETKDGEGVTVGMYGSLTVWDGRVTAAGSGCSVSLQLAQPKAPAV